MENFYGGRQGASFVIKKRFDAISVSTTVYRKRYYARTASQQVGDAQVNEGVPIWPLIERTGIDDDQYAWGLYVLDGHAIGDGNPNHTFPTETAEGMVEFFQQGAATTSEVNYGEYVIIDTVSGLQDTQNIHNGKIYVRGTDIDNGFGGAEYVGQITGITYVDTVTIDWANIINKPNNLVQDSDYHTFTQLEKNKLGGIEAGAQVNVQPDWDQDDDSEDDYIKNKPTNLSEFINDLDLDVINDSSSSLDQTYSSRKINNLLNDKVTTIVGKGLSSNDYTTEEKNKLSGITAGAKPNVQSDWSQSDSTADDFIKNKPSQQDFSAMIIDDDDEHGAAESHTTTYSAYKINSLQSFFEVMTQAEYDNIPIHDPSKLYIIQDEESEE